MRIIPYNDIWLAIKYAPLGELPRAGIYRKYLWPFYYAYIGAACVALYEIYRIIASKAKHPLVLPCIGMAVTSIMALLMPEDLLGMGIFSTATLAYRVDILCRIFQASCFDRLTARKDATFSLAKEWSIRAAIALVIVIGTFPSKNVLLYGMQDASVYDRFLNANLHLLYLLGVCAITLPAYLTALYRLYLDNQKPTLPTMAINALVICGALSLAREIVAVFSPIILMSLALMGNLLPLEPLINFTAAYLIPATLYVYWRPAYLLWSVATVVALSQAIRAKKK